MKHKTRNVLRTLTTATLAGAACTTAASILSTSCSSKVEDITYQLDGSSTITYGDTLTITVSHSNKLADGQTYEWSGIEDNWGIDYDTTSEGDQSILRITNSNIFPADIVLDTIAVSYDGKTKNIETIIAEAQTIISLDYSIDPVTNTIIVPHGDSLVITASSSSFKGNCTWDHPEDGSGITYSPSGSNNEILTITNNNTGSPLIIGQTSITVSNNGATEHIQYNVMCNSGSSLAYATLTANGTTYHITDNNQTFATSISGSIGPETYTINVDNGSGGSTTQVINPADITNVTFITNGNDTTLTTLPEYFLNGSGILTFPKLPTSTTIIDGYCLFNCINFDGEIALPGIATIGERFLQGCISFNHNVTLPNTLNTIGVNFLGACVDFNSTIDLGTSVHEINGGFLFGCTSFNQDLTIRSNIDDGGISVATDGSQNRGMLFGCDSMTATVDFGSLTTAAFSVSNTEYQFSTNTASTAYGTNTGVTFAGTNAAAIKFNFQDRDSQPYRKIIVNS